MFEVLLKAKLELEERIKDLERKKTKLIRQEIEKSTQQENLEIKIKISSDCQKLVEIKKNFYQYLFAKKQLSDEIKSANKLTDEIDKELDQLIESLGLELPENLQYIEENIEEENPVVNQTFSAEDSGSSDKENTIENLKEPEADNFDPDSFSPRIFISKPNSQNCETPAFKSAGRKQLFRRCLQD